MNLKTNADGELIFTNGTFETVTDREAIAQNIRSNIRTWKGEYFLNNLLGVDYIRGFQKGQDSFLRISIKQAILETVGVTDIEDFEYELSSDRTLTISCNVQTLEGTIPYKDEVVI
jgi:hypothetical protein